MTVSNLKTRSKMLTHLPQMNSPWAWQRDTGRPKMWVRTERRSKLLEEFGERWDLDKETEEPRDAVLPVEKERGKITQAFSLFRKCCVFSSAIN